MNFSVIVEPLTNLLHKYKNFKWQEKCQVAFEWAGAVLLQEDVIGVEHPVCYFSKKFEKGEKKYSTSEKKLFALVLALYTLKFMCQLEGVTSNSLNGPQSVDFSPLFNKIRFNGC